MSRLISQQLGLNILEPHRWVSSSFLDHPPELRRALQPQILLVLVRDPDDDGEGSAVARNEDPFLLGFFQQFVHVLHKPLECHLLHCVMSSLTARSASSI